MKTVMVLGLGEVGEPLYKMLRTTVRTIGNLVDVHDPAIDWCDRTGYIEEIEYDILHVCFPQSENFVKYMLEYIKKFKPRCVIIHSTLTPGMTRHLGEVLKASDIPKSEIPALVYSPVRGNMTEGMERGLRQYTKYFSFMVPGVIDIGPETVEKHLQDIGFKTEMVQDTESLEWAKILDLGLYGLNIAYYQELERIVTDNAMEYSTIRNFIESTPKESEGRAQRVVNYGGYIGGHCVMQAIDKILSLKDIPLLKAVVDSNRKREMELTFNPEDCIGKE